MALLSPSPPPPARRQFGVYENAAIASALSARSLKPSFAAFFLILLLAFASACSLVGLIYREQVALELITKVGIMQSYASKARSSPLLFACVVVKILQGIMAIVFLASMSALCKALSLQASADANAYAAPKPADSPKHRGKSNQSHQISTLTEHQQVLLGMHSGHHKKQALDKGEAELLSDSNVARQRPTRARQASSPSPSTQSVLLVPLHQSNSSKKSWTEGGSSSPWSAPERRDSSVGKVTSISPGGVGSAFHTTSYVSPTRRQTPPVDVHLSPWALHKSPVVKEEITSESILEKFLADVEDKLVESTSKIPASTQSLVTPPPTLRGVGGATPTSTPATAPHSSTPRSTPLRPLRMSPASQKFATSPKKGDGDLPLPMSMEQAIEAFRKQGVYPQIENWRDRLRQWFSEALLNPLVLKIDTSHLQVMQAASKLGLSITVTQVGGNRPDKEGPLQATDDSLSQEWHTTFAPDEDSLLHQLRAALVQARDAPPAPQPTVFGLQPTPPMRPINPLIQDCLDAVTEHQRLRALMKGEWAKGLLPQSSVRADYTVQRIRELSEGTCVKKFEFLGSGELYDKTAKRWTLELPTDSHLLVYLFCALLEHPKWMLHVDPTSHPSSQSGNNPLFVASMPLKERFPEKYVAVLSTAPAVQHMGACVLAVGKQSPPVFALYWDKKLQFSLQGRTSLWDAILLMCYRIKVAHGGIIRGINLGSSAFNLLSVFETPQQEISAS